MKQLLILCLLVPCCMTAMDHQADLGANSGGSLSTDMTQSTPSGSTVCDPDTSNYNNDLHISASDVQNWGSDSGSASGNGYDGCWSAKDN